MIKKALPGNFGKRYLTFVCLCGTETSCETMLCSWHAVEYYHQSLCYFVYTYTDREKHIPKKTSRRGAVKEYRAETALESLLKWLSHHSFVRSVVLHILTVSAAGTKFSQYTSPSCFLLYPQNSCVHSRATAIFLLVLSISLKVLHYLTIFVFQFLVKRLLIEIKVRDCCQRSKGFVMKFFYFFCHILFTHFFLHVKS